MTRRGKFARLLRDYRVASGLTQEELAARAQISSRTVGDLERACTSPHFRTVELLIAGLRLNERAARDLRAAGRACRLRDEDAASPQAAVAPDVRNTGCVAVAPAASAGRQMLPVAVHVLLFETDQVLLTRRPAAGSGDIAYCVPTRYLGQNESVLDAACREAAEAADVGVSRDDLTLVATLHRRGAGTNVIDLFLTAARWRGSPRIVDSRRYSGLLWCRRSDLPPTTLDHVRRVLHGEMRTSRIEVVHSGQSQARVRSVSVDGDRAERSRPVGRQ